MKSFAIAFKTWLLTSFLIGVGMLIYFAVTNEFQDIWISFLISISSLIASLPAMIVIAVALPFIQKKPQSLQDKWLASMLLIALICIPYAGFLTIVFGFGDSNNSALLGFLALFSSSGLALLLQRKNINRWFSENIIISPISNHNVSILKPIKTMIMNTDESSVPTPGVGYGYTETTNNGNKHLLKAGITAFLILAMLIPANFISSLVNEREQRQKEVTKEVSEKWAAPQTISTPYVVIPYKQLTKDDKGKIVNNKQTLFIAPTNLNVKAQMQPELRRRSIYDVLLYKSNINISGSINLVAAKDIAPEDIELDKAFLCLGLTDLKGIDEKVLMNVNGKDVEMEPGLPNHKIDQMGLSVPLHLAAENLNNDLSFQLQMKIKGTEQMHFVPLSDNSKFEISSPWKDPSFDGSTLPKERVVNETGFTAVWSFNKANMPVLPQLLNTNADKDAFAFGLTMVQAGDQYAKTNKSVKYAILFVGLTFAMFFIIELMQKQQVHPVQYLLVGLALIIFYTLLLSIGEFIGFDKAYGIAASATVLLIAFYAQSLFSSWKIGVVFSLFLGLLYGFIYILIQLEDTALLAGSIGLFILLAIAMYFSKKIKWHPVTPALSVS